MNLRQECIDAAESQVRPTSAKKTSRVVKYDSAHRVKLDYMEVGDKSEDESPSCYRG